MVKRPSFQTCGGTDMDSTMTPMIDVVFLLLIFFVWTAGTQVTEYILHNHMSAMQGNEASTIDEPDPDDDFDSVILRLRFDGNLPDWTINEQPMMTLRQVSETLIRLARVKPDAPIIVHPDKNVPIGFVIEVYDTAKLSGFDKVSFTVNRVK